MIKIYSYELMKNIELEEVTNGMQLRIEGNLFDVNHILDIFNYEEITEGHEENIFKRVYIKIKETELKVDEYINKKEFDREAIKIIRENSDIELQSNIWHYENDTIGFEFILIDDDFNRLLDIAYISQYSNKLEGLANTKENIELLLKEAKKIKTKFSKWCKTFDINVKDIQVLTV